MRRYNDSVVQSRVDRRQLATVARWLATNGVQVRSMSELGRECINLAADMVSEIMRWRCDDSEEATIILDGLMGNGSLNSKRVSYRNLIKNQNYSDFQRTPSLTNNDPGYVNKDYLAEYERQEKLEKERRLSEEKEKQIKRQNENIKYDENGLCINPTVNLQARPDNIEEWKKVEKPTVDKEVVSKKSAEYIAKKAAELMEEKGYNPGKEDLTPRKMTNEEWEEKQRKDKERADEINRAIAVAPPATA